jgi:hypothetical protein
MRWAIGLTCFSVSTSNASPNDPQVVIVIIIVGEADLKFHGGDIIAQEISLKRFSLCPASGGI